MFFCLFFLAIGINIGLEVKAVDELPDNGAIVSSAQIILTKTGVGPFDDNDEPGNDSSENNKIVRSFDQVTWTVENTFALNTEGEGYTGGTIYFEASLPANVFEKNEIMWDLDSMPWIEEPSISNDGQTLTGHYSLSTESLTIPGKQSLAFILNVYGVKNGTKFSPTFKTWLNGNLADQYATVVGEEITISSAPKYNVYLGLNNQMGNGKKTTLEYGGETITGRVHGFGIGLALFNDSDSKGLKGIEYPKGDITFELDLKVDKVPFSNPNSSIDITNECTPILWDYKLNNYDETGNMGKNMKFGGNTATVHGFAILPYASGSNKYSVYDSGNIIMRQEGKKLYVTIKDYKFNGKFPTYTTFGESGTKYSDRNGYFGAYYVQVFVPLNEYSTEENYNYYLTVTDNNFKAKSLSDSETTIQKVTSDDSIRNQNVVYPKGNWTHSIRIYDKNKRTIAEPYSSGNAYATIGQEFFIWVDTVGAKSNDEENSLRSINKLVKFDGNFIEPTKIDGKYYRKATAEYTGTIINYKMWFVTKKDGTNWNSQSEMNNANEEDLLFYSNLEDIPENAVCVGEYFESQSGYVTNGYDIIYIGARVKDSAKIGETFGITQSTAGWEYVLDRNIYTIENENVTWPDDTGFLLKNLNYTKTEYDDNMNIIVGTHSGGAKYGQSVLILGGDLRVTKKSIDNLKNSKVNFDFSRNEYIVNYQINPSIITSTDRINIDDIDIVITDVLPKGVTYIPNSSNYGNPEIETYSDGKTVLTWNIYGKNVHDTIEPIEYKASLSEELTNGTLLESEVEIKEIPKKDEFGNISYKLGNPSTNNTNNRKASVSIQIINLASHRLYKSVTTPVIEKNGQVHYTISYKNNTDEIISNFQLLDILPYNGDSRGTDYSGTYKLAKLVVTQKDGNGSVISNGNLDIRYTEDEGVRTTVTRKDSNLANDVIQVSSENILKAATAYAI